MLSFFPVVQTLRAFQDDLNRATEQTIDAKIDRAIQTILQEMSQCKYDATYPSGLLLLFAQEHYNLRNNPLFPMRIPDEVKWQLLHAAGAGRDDKKIIRLGAEFGYEHLSHDHLAHLLMILTAYHEFEKAAKGASNAIFSKHMFMIESMLEHMCWTKPQEGFMAIVALKGTYNSVLNPIIEKMEKILAHKDRYLAIPNTFEHNPMLFEVFTAINPAALKGVLNLYGPKTVMTQVKDNYDGFIKWMKTISDMEVLETDPALQRAVRRWKSEIQDRFYNKHFKLLCQITEAYPKVAQNTLAGGGSLAVLDNGARIMLEKFQSKGSIKGTPVICSSYEDYKEKLGKLASEPAKDGHWYFSIRCEQRSPYVYNVHQTGAYIEREGGKVFVQIIDATPYDFDNGPYKVAGLTREVFPESIMNSTMVARQRDFNNCAFFMFNDMKAISRNGQNISWLRASSIPILDFVDKKFGIDALAYWKLKAPEANKYVNVTAAVPLDFMMPTQSLSEVERAVRANQGPSSPEMIRKLKERVARHKLIEVSADSAVTGSDVSGYAKLKAMKYRLYIVSQIFE